MSALSSQKMELLALLLEREGIKPLATIPAKRDGGAAPLSFAQQRLWFLQQMFPDSSAYNIPQVWKFQGDLKVDAVCRSLSEVIRRHEILRTTFATVDGEPVQIVNPPPVVSMEEIDLRGLSPTDREAEVQRLSIAEADQPFDLAHGPLFRVRLLRTGEQQRLALFTTHHIVADEWSQKILVRELNVLFDAFVRGRPSPLPELTTQYSDFARWQREWLQSKEAAKQLAYWKEQLSGDLPVIQLPLDRPRPAVQTFHGAALSSNLSESIVGPLRVLARQENASLFIVLLAAFKLLLHRYTGENDVLVGTLIAGRNRPEIEDLIGFFVNTLVLRTELSGDLSYRQVLQRVRQTTLKGFEHQDIPFDVLVRELRPERSLSYTPLFQVAFMLRTAVRGTASSANSKMTEQPSETTPAKFDLTMIAQDNDPGVTLYASYNSDLFERVTIENLLGHFGQLLQGIAANPDAPHSTLSLLSDGERQRLLVEWNDTRTEFPDNTGISQLFEAQVARTPEATALVVGDEQLTYSELNRRANKLAWHLRELGVRAEVPVGLCAERSVELVVGLLAIWKAGGAYVPLDPQYPATRLAFIIADTGMPVLITEKRLAEIIPPHDAELVCWDADADRIGANPDDNLEIESKPEDLAYIIYTSGSTGQPKGVLVEHRQLTNTLLGSQEAFDFNETDVMPCIASSSFDIFLFELLNPLLAGGCSLLMSSLDVMETSVAINMLDRITSLHAVPGLMRQLLRAGGDGPGREHVRQVFIGGDSVSPDLLADLERAFPAARINVLYGPTEAAMICTRYTMARSQPVSHQMIGKPLSNVVLRIHDSYGNLVPTGVAGEIYIGGAGVARGYLNRDELTAEKFVELDGQRFYRSGDVGRYLPDGNIAFMGRIDNQVKVRGFRVELGEVQRALRAQAGVRDAVVIARADDGGDKALFAYIVADNTLPLSLSALRRELREQLPEYMVPAAFVLLDEIPLTTNGKLDLKALPKVDRTTLQPDETFSPPRTPTENIVADIWANVLGLPEVGASDNFFELGGHSLLATKAVSQIKQTFKVDVPLRALFEAPTVREFSAVVEARQRANYHLDEMPIGKVPRDGNLPLSFAQQRLWFHDQMAPGNAAYNISASVKLTGTLSVAALERALEEIIRRHESLRTTFSTVSFQPVQVISPSLPLPLKKIDLRPLPPEEREIEARNLATAEIRAPFDLTHGPLLRVALTTLDDEEHLLVLTMHHIISDGWSTGVLIGEFVKLYEAFVTDQPSPLPDLSLQYADYAYWQREWLQGEVFETQLAYWRGQLGTDFTETPLPLDRPRPAQQSFRGEHQNFFLSKELSDKLNALSRKEGVTTFMLMLGAFKALLHSYSGATDIVVGTDVANRNHIETEGLIGFFANQLVLRTDLSGDPSFSEILARVREVALGAYAHQDLPFDKVVEALKPERDLSRNPLFQVMFGFRNAPMSSLSLPDLSLIAFPLEDGTAVFDLSFYLTDTPQGLAGLLRFNTDIFDTATITRMWQRYETLLSYVADDPTRKLSELRTHLEESTEKELTQKRKQLLKNTRRQSIGTRV
jgi:amino acid adenylation domain-containing protein